MSDTLSNAIAFVIWLLPLLVGFGGLFLQMFDAKKANLCFIISAILSEIVVSYWAYTSTHGGLVTMGVWALATIITVVAATAICIYARNKQKQQEPTPTPVPILGFNAHTMPTDPQYKSRTRVAGISWRKNYSDVRLNITIGSIPVQNLDLYIALDTQIAAIKQISNLTGISIFPDGSMPSFSMSGTDEKGKPVAFSVFPATGEDIHACVYRIQCKRISSNTVLQFIIAGIAVNPPNLDGSLPKSLFPPKRNPETITVFGQVETSDLDGRGVFEVNFATTFKKIE